MRRSSALLHVLIHVVRPSLTIGALQSLCVFEIRSLARASRLDVLGTFIESYRLSLACDALSQTLLLVHSTLRQDTCVTIILTKTRVDGVLNKYAQLDVSARTPQPRLRKPSLRCFCCNRSAAGGPEPRFYVTQRTYQLRTSHGVRGAFHP